MLPTPSPPSFAPEQCRHTHHNRRTHTFPWPVSSLAQQGRGGTRFVSTASLGPRTVPHTVWPLSEHLWDESSRSCHHCHHCHHLPCRQGDRGTSMSRTCPGLGNPRHWQRQAGLQAGRLSVTCQMLGAEHFTPTTLIFHISVHWHYSLPLGHVGMRWPPEVGLFTPPANRRTGIQTVNQTSEGVCRQPTEVKGRMPVRFQEDDNGFHFKTRTCREGWRGRPLLSQALLVLRWVTKDMQGLMRQKGQFPGRRDDECTVTGLLSGAMKPRSSGARPCSQSANALPPRMGT